jgi:hypothetical protein
MTVPGRDLTRADARHAIQEARRTLGALNHLAIAGTAHVDEMGVSTATMLASVRGAALELINVLGQAALQLPEEDGTDG